MIPGLILLTFSGTTSGDPAVIDHAGASFVRFSSSHGWANGQAMLLQVEIARILAVDLALL